MRACFATAVCTAQAVQQLVPLLLLLLNNAEAACAWAQSQSHKPCLDSLHLPGRASSLSWRSHINGCGKSSLLRLIMGRERLIAGEVAVSFTTKVVSKAAVQGA